MKKHSSRAGAVFFKNTAPELEPEPCLRKQRAPEPEPFHFYKSYVALHRVTNRVPKTP